MPHPTCHAPAAAAPGVPDATAYEMRPARAADRDAVTVLIDDRINSIGRRAAKEQTTVDLKVSRAAVLNYLGEQEDGQPLVWLLCADAEIVGCAAVLPGTSSWVWDPAQRAEPAHSMVGLFTRPAPGARLAWRLTGALLDRAWRLPVEDGHIRWLRSTTTSAWGMHYACAALGFSVPGGVMRGTGHVYLLQRRACAVPGLAALVTTPHLG
ncbi:hypothetical protein ACFU99_01925 [Streptomyces sp. NPDC057654]|uniref:hypothetical protein n=1 Tax=Streptomyces sp. NPDC057654 TaxID=3346196 RepID=UPI0036D03275